MSKRRWKLMASIVILFTLLSAAPIFVLAGGGVIPTYLAWVPDGLIGIFLLLDRKAESKK